MIGPAAGGLLYGVSYSSFERRIIFPVDIVDRIVVVVVCVVVGVANVVAKEFILALEPLTNDVMDALPITSFGD